MKNLHTFFRKSNWGTNGRLFGFGTSPEADWKIIFISAVLLIILAIASSVFIFVKIDKGEVFALDKSLERKGETLNISLLRETVSYYQNKASEFEKIKNTKVSAVDPSL